jgi:hypothetical protein
VWKGERGRWKNRSWEDEKVKKVGKKQDRGMGRLGDGELMKVELGPVVVR